MNVSDKYLLTVWHQWEVRTQQWLDDLTIKANQIITVSPVIYRQDQK